MEEERGELLQTMGRLNCVFSSTLGCPSIYMWREVDPTCLPRRKGKRVQRDKSKRRQKGRANLGKNHIKSDRSASARARACGLAWPGKARGLAGSPAGGLVAAWPAACCGAAQPASRARPMAAWPGRPPSARPSGLRPTSACSFFFFFLFFFLFLYLFLIINIH